MDTIRVLCLFTIMNRGGAETMCMNLYRNIDRTKVQFDFLVYYPQRGQYEDEIEELGGHIFRIPHLDPKNLISHIRGARSFFRQHPEYHIVHNHMGETGAFICREAKRFGVRTIIYHSHFDRVKLINLSHVNRTHHGFINMKQLKLQMLFPIAIRTATDYFACGENAAKVFGNRRSKVQILNNAINIQKFLFNENIRREKRLEMHCDNNLIIGNVARINDTKNQVFAIYVIKKLLKINPAVQMWFVGDGEKKKELSEKVVLEGLENHIKFLGVRSDVAELLQAMDIFVFPSIAEGLPVACIEAQAAGLPCVFSDGFDPETVITDNCKVLSLNEPIQKWVEAILSLQQVKRIDTSNQIREHGYDIHETAKHMQEFYLSKAGIE